MIILSALQTSFLIPILIILGISAAIELFLCSINVKVIPAFVIEILIGIAIAPWFNKYIIELEMVSFINALYIVGLSLIIFLSGYEVELGLLKDNERTGSKHINVFRIALGIFIAVLSISVGLGFFMFFTQDISISEKWLQTGLLLSIVFSSSFAGLVSPLIHIQKMQNTILGKIFDIFSDLSEIISIILLSIFMIITGVTSGLIWILLVMILILVLWSRLSSRRSFFEKVTSITDYKQLPVRMLIMLILGLVLLSDLAGVEYILGAYAAGMVTRSANIKKETFKKVEHIIYAFFVPLFFVIVGTRIDIVSFVKEGINIVHVLYILIGLLVARIPMLYLLRWFKLKKLLPMILLSTTTIIVCIAASHIGVHLELFTEAFGDAIVLAGIITCIVTPIIFRVVFPLGEHTDSYRLQNLVNQEELFKDHEKSKI